MGQILAGIVKRWAEGSFGQPAARVYWWLAGKKTWTGIILGTAYAALMGAQAQGVCVDCGSWANWIGIFGGLLFAWGLSDAQLRTAPPTKPAGIR